MKSMTGYALCEEHNDKAFVSVEIKSYNSRYLDLNLNFPFWLSSLEHVFKSFFSSKISRGKVDVNLRVKDLNLDVNISANTSAAKAYYTAMLEIASAVDAPYSIDINSLCEREGVLTIEKNIDLSAWETLLMPIFEKAFSVYEKTRMQEGQALYKDISINLDKIFSNLEIIKENAPKLEQIFYRSIREHLKELSDVEINEQRIMQEIAIMLVKYTINEEIVRLEAHCKTLHTEIRQNCPMGKRIDFICQEINREINTIGSKNQMIEIAQPIITVKEALENIREQCRNVE